MRRGQNNETANQTLSLLRALAGAAGRGTGEVIINGHS